MPSKKKQSKTPSRQSNSDPSASPRTPSVTSLDSEVSEEDLRCSFEQVSRRYPSLIGQSAFIGRVNDVDSETRGCKIWLSEGSMVASYLTPGSLVSVSLAALKNKHSNGFPLSSITDECGKLFGVDLANETAKEVGNYFALATVFPSCKVLKNGVRLSANLSSTLGSPSSGSIVLVHPIQSEFRNGLVHESEKEHNPSVNCLSLCSCKQLHLELTSFKNTVKTSNDLSSKMEFSTGNSYDRFENGIISSPQTPLCQPKLSSHSGQLASPLCEGSTSNFSKPNGLCVDSFDVKEILRDESSKKLLETCAASWLYSRNLLCGNIVAIPILSALCIFRVRGAGFTNQDLMNGRNHSLPPQTIESMEHVNNAFVVDHETKVYLCLPSDLSSETLAERPSSCVQSDLEDVKTTMEPDISELGGLSKEYAVLKEIISSSVKNALSSFGLQTTKGVLLHGPPGTGKTSLARLCVHDAGVNLFYVNGPEIVSEYHGESEQELHKIFESATQAVPSVVFIDELDAIAPARKEGGEQLSQRIVATLLNLMDGICRTDGVLVIAATNRPDSIEPALRRPGRLGRELEIGVPSPKQRLDILCTLLSKMDHCISDMQVQQLAMATHGFVGADLAFLCNEAALVCLRRYTKFKVKCQGLDSCGIPITYVAQAGNNMEEMECGSDLRDTSTIFSDSSSSWKMNFPDSAGTVSQITSGNPNCNNNISEGMPLMKENCLLRLAFEDFEKARMKVRPSAMREVILEVPKVNWEDVGGQREVKNQLMEAVEWPQKHQDAFKRIGTRPPTGVLMFGPPGCSKTLMARAVASEAGLNFLAVKGPELFSKWVGESEKAVRSLFAKARANAPSIIFFDEIDSLAIIRGRDSDGISVSDRVMSQLLVELDGLHQRVDVTVIAATNRPDKIDTALLRPGRFDRLLYVGPPNENDREDIFRIHLRKIPCSSDVSLKELAYLTEGCTGADISLICREAAVTALEESLDAEAVTMRHLKAAIRQVRPSDIHLYQELSAKFERLVHSSAVEKTLGSQRCSTGFTLWIS
ncbi:calmodulin-interacting protein 111 isoform X3 [Durio zibethinus]|uniref:Calmodulin-interacting protein 111 isoform X3 n=1 Tax=Durio zibethinus TaxID=66656 RepID=A0A6P5ZWD8_DURZI|nr:calmodulin-interacting protein 111 isoform X3 [Durio zibethinus]